MLSSKLLFLVVVVVLCNTTNPEKEVRPLE